MNRLSIACTLFVCALSVFACAGSASDSGDVKKNSSAKYIDYGNGVFYFPCTGDDFGNALSKFITGHPKCTVSSMASDGAHISGIDAGYFVVCQPKLE